jgi:hypothetical protein
MHPIALIPFVESERLLLNVFGGDALEETASGRLD